MILRLDLTTDLFPRLTQIAKANHRDLKEQVLYYLEWAVTLEWELNGAEIAAKLAHRQAQQDAFWEAHPCRARGRAQDVAPRETTHG